MRGAAEVVRVSTRRRSPSLKRPSARFARLGLGGGDFDRFDCRCATPCAVHCCADRGDRHGSRFVTESWAAGAFAIGKCGAYGQAYDYRRRGRRGRAASSARASARAVTMKRACAAFAVDMANPCGAHGYAVSRGFRTRSNEAHPQMLPIRRQGMRDPRLGLRRQGLGCSHSGRPDAIDMCRLSIRSLIRRYHLTVLIGRSGSRISS